MKAILENGIVFFILNIWTLSLFGQQNLTVDQEQPLPESCCLQTVISEPQGPSLRICTSDTTRWVLPFNGGTSQNSRAPSNYFKYQRTEYLITPAEMMASGFTAGLNINSIGFLIQTEGIETLTGSFNIYLKNTGDTFYSLGNGWNISGFTSVSSSAAYTVMTAGNAFFITFSNGIPFTYTGGGIYVAWDFSAPVGAILSTSIPVTHGCHYQTEDTLLYGNRNNSSMPVQLTGSLYRPATLFSTSQDFADQLSVTNIYSLGKVPVPVGIPAEVTVRLENNSASAATFDLTLNVVSIPTAVIRYSASQNGLTIQGDTAILITFQGWSPDAQEDVVIKAYASQATDETWTENNELQQNCRVNDTIFSYAFSNPTINKNYGFTFPGLGIFSSRYYMHGSGSITGTSILIGNNSTAVGDTISAVALNSSGTIIAQSALHIIQTNDLSTLKLFTFPSPPTVANALFYIGMATTRGTSQYYPIGTSYDIPPRENTFFIFPIGGGEPQLFSHTFQFDIEAHVIPNDYHDVGISALNPIRIFPQGTVIPNSFVSNYGTTPESFSTTMTIGSYSSTQWVSNLQPGEQRSISFDPWNSTTGSFIMIVCTELSGDQNPFNNCDNQPVYVKYLNKNVYGYITDPGTGSQVPGVVSFNIGDPGALQVIAGQPSLPPLAAGTWVNSEWFAAEKSTVSPYNLVKINPSTGNRTVIGNMGAPIRGISYNPVNGILYGVSATGLYSISRITGQTTLLGSISGSSLVTLAIHKTGQAYGADILNDRLVTLNLTTSQITPIGPLLFDAGEDLDMEFDTATGNLYMTAGTSVGGTLRWVDRYNGNALLIGYFEDGATICGLAVPSGVTLPSVTTTPISGVTDETANGGGTTTSQTGSQITSKGLCWSDMPNPTLSSPHLDAGPGAGTFTFTITGLSEYTNYYVRAYASTTTGTAYGNEVTLRTLASPCGADITYEGKTYQTVQVGDQCWMKQNLNVGTMINSNLEQTDNQIVEKYCYDNLESNCDVYGGLYQWEEACQYNYPYIITDVVPPSSQGACPEGFAVSSNWNWDSTGNTLGGFIIAGGKMKEAGYLHWTLPNSGACNSSGFTGLPGGMRYQDGNFYDLTYSGNFWSFDRINDSVAWSYVLSFYSDDLDHYTDNIYNAYSVRCIKTNLPLPDTMIIQTYLVPPFPSYTPCYKAGEVLIIAGNGNHFIVPDTGRANLNAGVKIRLLSGTQVVAGGYLSARIIQNGLYCEDEGFITILKSSPGDYSEAEPSYRHSHDPLFIVYPNPSQGDFNLKMSSELADDDVMLTVHDLRGEEILSKRVSTGFVYTFSLDSYPAGVYFVRVVSGSMVATKLLIKQN